MINGPAPRAIGAHVIVYSTNPDTDRAFFKDVLGLPNVDVGQGWLIFGLPPAEVAVHPSDENGAHELYLMTDDVEALVAAMEKRGLACDPVQALAWGILTRVTLPGGGKLGVYQPRHARPEPMRVAAPKRTSSKKKAARKPTPKKTSAKKAPARKAPAKKAPAKKPAPTKPAPKKGRARR